FSSRRRHTRFSRDWSSDVCSSDLPAAPPRRAARRGRRRPPAVRSRRPAVRSRPRTPRTRRPAAATPTTRLPAEANPNRRPATAARATADPGVTPVHPRWEHGPLYLGAEHVAGGFDDVPLATPHALAGWKKPR